MIAICEVVKMPHDAAAVQGLKKAHGLGAAGTAVWVMQGKEAGQCIVTRFLCVYTAETGTPQSVLKFDCQQPQYKAELESALQR